MWYVHYFDSEQYSSELEEFGSERLATEFINDLIKSGEDLADITLIQGTEIKLKAIEVTTKVVRA